MDFLVLCLLCVFRHRSLRLADPSSRGVPPLVCVCVCVCLTLSVCASCCLVVHRNIFALTFHWLYFVVPFVPQVNHHITLYFVVLVFISPLFSAFLSFLILNVCSKVLPQSRTVLKFIFNSPNFPSSPLSVLYCCLCQYIILYPLLVVCPLAFPFPNIRT
jgi:hypothetical protein